MGYICACYILVQLEETCESVLSRWVITQEPPTFLRLLFGRTPNLFILLSFSVAATIRFFA